MLLPMIGLLERDAVDNTGALGDSEMEPDAVPVMANDGPGGLDDVTSINTPGDGVTLSDEPSDVDLVLLGDFGDLVADTLIDLEGERDLPDLLLVGDTLGFAEATL